MSLKMKTFTNVITNPMNTHNFVVDVPGMDENIMLAVESTDYPAQGQYRDVTLWFQGEKINYPGLPENGGEWKFKIPESDDGKIMSEFKRLNDLMYDQRTGTMIPTIWKDIHVYERDLNGNVVFEVILHGSWVKKRENMSLNAAQPENAAKWDFSFYYNWIEDVLHSNAGSPNPLP